MATWPFGQEEKSGSLINYCQISPDSSLARLSLVDSTKEGVILENVVAMPYQNGTDGYDVHPTTFEKKI